MLILAVFFAAILINTEVCSLPQQDLDLESILQYARDGKPDKKDRENLSGKLKSQDIAELVQKATEDRVLNDVQDEKREYRDAEELLKELTVKHKTRHNKKDKVKFGHYYNENKDFDKNALEEIEDNEFDDNDERFKNSRFNEQALEEVLSRNVKKYDYLKPRLTSANNAGSVELNNNKNDDDDQDEYSKIYIILNPQAIEKSGNKKNLNQLLSRILSLTSSPESRSEVVKTPRLKEPRYKGFPVNFARRVRRDSREMFANSGEDDYKPKRNRNERGSMGGGGGNAGGRTAIPYIRNRGDIYERDH